MAVLSPVPRPELRGKVVSLRLEGCECRIQCAPAGDCIGQEAGGAEQAKQEQGREPVHLRAEAINVPQFAHAAGTVSTTQICLSQPKQNKTAIGFLRLHRCELPHTFVTHNIHLVAP